MKKTLLFASIAAIVLTTSCDNNTKSEGAHTHDDGSTHTDHADTIKPAQQEFNVADTTKKDTSTHTHANGEKHSH
jgi:hypothetical protein